ncbi:MAG: hypothetical protein NC311_16715 [Muribaculaceae bacterium]|nr:hypothetical protein [Muribaculaceae bacterium]
MNNTHENFWNELQGIFVENGETYSLEFTNTDIAKILFNKNFIALEILITATERVCLRKVNKISQTIIFSEALSSIEIEPLLLKINQIRKEILNPNDEKHSDNKDSITYSNTFSSQLLSGTDYGTNAKKIYTKLCTLLNFDSNKINQFGMFKPLYATFADTYRKADVWFICYSNFNKFKDKNENREFLEKGQKINIIENNGNSITEIVPEKCGRSNTADRITFVKVKKDNKWTYVFYGIYKLTQNGTTRHYDRISKIYPIIVNLN